MGEDKFSYRVRDSEGVISTGEVHVTINNRGVLYERFNDISVHA